MMPAGEYYIGDLCYVMRSNEEWDEFCKETLLDTGIVNGEVELNGRRVATYQTEHGDGCYYDQIGNEYSVDAGLIGCIRVDDIKDFDRERAIDLGALVNFKKDFNTLSKNGVIKFGKIRINTDI